MLDKLADTIDKATTTIVKQVTSGRFITTVVLLFVYAKLALAGAVKPEQVQAITVLVIPFYFAKKRLEEGS